MTATTILAGYEIKRNRTKTDTGSAGGQPVYVSLHHLAAFGMTQKAGKTTLLEALIGRSGLRALAFILKRGESGFHSYHRIPPYFKGRSDWHWLEGLLNVSLNEKVKYEPGMRGAIMAAAEGTRGDLSLIAAKVAKMGKSEPNRFMRDVYYKLGNYMRDVAQTMSHYQFADRLDLEQGVNVMDLSSMEEDPEIQQLVIAASLEQIHTQMRDVIAVVPEAWEQLPQGKMTPVKWAAERYIRKGASIGNYLWIDSQDTGGLDKTPLRQVDNWFFGRMKESHETERIAKQLLGVKLPRGEIETLGLGVFYAVIGNRVLKMYALPLNVPPDVGQMVAMGRMTPEIVQQRFLKQPPPAPPPTKKQAPSQLEVLRDIQRRIETLTDATTKPAEQAPSELEKLRDLQKQIEALKPEPKNPAPLEISVERTVEKTTEVITPNNPGNVRTEPKSTETPNAETWEIHEPVQLIAVKDQKGTLTAETTTLLGQIGGLIVENTLSPGKRYIIKNFRELLRQEYGGQWDENEVMQTLRTLTAPPYRLFTHFVDTGKHNFFILRDRAKTQVKQA